MALTEPTQSDTGSLVSANNGTDVCITVITLDCNDYILVLLSSYSLLLFLY